MRPDVVRSRFVAHAAGAMASERKGKRSVDVRAIAALGARPRRRGCGLTLLLFGVLPFLLCGLFVYGLFSMELSAVERGCMEVPVGMARADVESLLIRDLNARRLGFGGPSGGPVTAIELGDRGEVISWSCQVLLDADGNATRSHFHSWVVPSIEGHRTPPIPGLPGMGELPLPAPSFPIPGLPSRAPSSIPDLDDPNLPPEIRDALDPESKADFGPGTTGPKGWGNGVLRRDMRKKDLWAGSASALQ